MSRLAPSSPLSRLLRAGPVALALGTMLVGTGCIAALGIEDLEYKENGGLVDRGLVARYHIDEATEGNEPSLLMDVDVEPVPLTLSYSGGMGFTEIDGHRGLRWNGAGQYGIAAADIEATKIKARLHGATRATIEAVIQVAEVTSSFSRFVSITTPDVNGRLSLLSSNGEELSFYWQSGTEAGRWQFPFTRQDRMVIHLVLDTTQGDAVERVQLYIDNVKIGLADGTPPELGQTVDLDQGSQLLLGNHNGSNQPRSFGGTLFYVALYDTAFRSDDIAINAEVLSLRDDLHTDVTETP